MIINTSKILEAVQMETNKGDKRLFFAGLIFALAYFIYDYYTNPCSVYNQLFLVHNKVIDKKYIYQSDEQNKISKAVGTSECDKLFELKRYYKEFDSKILINNIFYDFDVNLKYEILKYNYQDSIAYIKIYNSSPRMVKEVYKIVSMKCLHDTLPTGYEEYTE